MALEIDLDPKGREHFSNIDLGLLDCVEENLTKLADDPDGLSQPGAPPLRSDRFYFTFRCEDYRGTWTFTVSFNYSEDGQKIIVRAINWHAPRDMEEDD